ncbi:hypothetical protein [Solibacillus sp. CAU 1738]|uniref:hypothetical protein n=1 Tax=Solibacillus sp. CAU 1738 TaxID=3140363 RepID=UPI003261AEC5
MVIECQKCESREMKKTQYSEEGYIVETSYTCKDCGNYVGTDSYGSWCENEEFAEVETV